jgi:hypothetical protein
MCGMPDFPLQFGEPGLTATRQESVTGRFIWSNTKIMTIDIQSL